MSITRNPSFRAAAPSLSSSVATTSDEGCCSAAVNAAASCSASAARNGWTRRKRIALSRTLSLGSISCHPTSNSFSRCKARAIIFSSAAPSRSRRASADMHSTREPHQTSISGSSLRSSCKRRVNGSATRSGTIADASQNLTGPRAVLRVAPPTPMRRLSAVAAPPSATIAVIVHVRDEQRRCGSNGPAVHHHLLCRHFLWVRGARPDDHGQR
jgi:hypothetical protein